MHQSKMMAKSSNNTNNMITFDEGAGSLYDQAQMDRFIAKLNKLINGLRRG